MICIKLIMQVKKNLKTKTRIFDFKLPDFKNVKLGLFEIFWF